jgi:uncharacterized protein (DUF58 family)
MRPHHFRFTEPSLLMGFDVVRYAWPPSAGAHTQRQAVEVPSGERRRVTTVLRPTRRGDRHAGRVTVRAFGPLGLAASQGSHEVPWSVRALPAFESRKHLPSRLARLRELDGRASVLVRGQGTEFDSLRDYVVGDDDDFEGHALRDAQDAQEVLRGDDRDAQDVL